MHTPAQLRFYLDVRVISEAFNLLHHITVVPSSQLRHGTDHVDSDVETLQNLTPLGGCKLLVELRLGQLGEDVNLQTYRNQSNTRDKTSRGSHQPEETQPLQGNRRTRA